MEDERCSAAFYSNIFSLSLGNAEPWFSKFPTKLKATTAGFSTLPSRPHLSTLFYSPHVTAIRPLTSKIAQKSNNHTTLWKFRSSMLTVISNSFIK